MIHLAGPVVLAAVLAGTGVYGVLARRNAVLVLVGAELLLNAAGLLLIIANALPAGGLAGLARATALTQQTQQTQPGPADPLLPGQVLTLMLVTIAAAEIGVALAVILLIFRQRATSDLSAIRELGEASATYTEAVPGPASSGLPR